MRPGNNPVEKVKAEKDGLDILEEIEELSANAWGLGDARPRRPGPAEVYRRPSSASRCRAS